LDQVKNPKLALSTIHDKNKVKRGVAPIYDLPPLAWGFVFGAQKCLQFWSIKEIAEGNGTRTDERKYLLDHRLGRLMQRSVKLGQPSDA
jgi:hypothetical protein